ncbi:MAG: proline dehydrogenase family protein [Actinomycetota bacterium]|nr:proline dehydrogenase family protein [Actinomycetota bacterium]
MIREALTAIARNETLGQALSRAPVARDVFRRVVGGDTVAEALEVAAGLADQGYWASLERAAPAVTDGADADRVLADYLSLVDSLATLDLAAGVEIAVLPGSLGAHEGVATAGAFERLDRLCAHAASAGTPVMVGMGPADEVGRTLEWVEPRLSAGGSLGVTLQASLRRTHADCARLAGYRVRLVKGGHRADAAMGYGQPLEVDKSFVRCAKVLLAGSGDPSFATHDPRLVEIVADRAERYGRPVDGFEFAFYLGRLASEQRRLAESGHRVRIYVPYGPDWFARLVGGLAERPSGVAAAVRSLLPG